jgi:ATP-binding cassette subfamily B protein
MAVSRAESLVAMSVLPGRVRWEVRGLRDDAALARLLVDAVGSHDRVMSASASAASGRILVEFDPTLSVEDLEASIEVVATRHRAVTPHRSAWAGPLALTSGGGDSVARAWSAGLRWAIGREEDDVYAQQALLLLGGLLSPHAQRLRLSLYGAAAANVVGVLRIVPIAFAMNAIAHDRVGPLGRYPTVGIMSAAAAAATLVRGRLRQRSQILWNSAARDLQHDLRMIVWERVQGAEAELLEDGLRNHAIAILVDDVNECESGMDATYALLDLGLNTVIMGATLFTFAAAVGGVASLPIPALLAIAFTLHPKVQDYFMRAGEANERLSERLGDAVAGLLTSRSFTQEAAEAERIGAASESYREAAIRSTAAAVSLPVWLESAVLVGQLGIYLLNSHRVARGATVGELSVINSLTGHLLFPLTTVGPLLENMQRGLAAFDRVSVFMSDTSAEAAGGRRLRRADVVGEIEYRDVSFRYASGQQVFDGVSLGFAANSWTGVVGPTGSGKSSLLKLLVRLHEPEGGRIMLDGRDIGTLRRADLRQAVAIVPQEPFVFQRSIHDNIAFGSRGASRQAVIEAAKAAQAHEFIEGLPEGYDTVIGKGGQGLSAGERQRLAIARALVKDAPIVVLDEAISGLDSGTEMSVEAALRRLFRGKTVVVIAHRLSAVRNADRILVVEHGRVVQEGTHRALVRKRGLYRSLWQSQLGAPDGHAAAPG